MASEVMPDGGQVPEEVWPARPWQLLHNACCDPHAVSSYFSGGAACSWKEAVGALAFFNAARPSWQHVQSHTIDSRVLD